MLKKTLIDAFVKITNDQKKEPANEIAYGTVVVKDGVTYIHLDGAPTDIDTPVTLTSSAKSGDRMQVMIKNHTLMTFGNFSDPAGGIDAINAIAEMVVSYQEATEANITVIETDIQTLYTSLSNKVDKETGKGLSTNDYTTAEKNKLAGIESGATKTVIDTALNASSTNPVQNKVINGALSDINTRIDTLPTYSVMSGATATVDGAEGLVPKPVKGKQTSFLRGDATWVSISKSTVGLANVDNTSDLNKPISTAVQNALSNKVDKETGKGLSTNDYTTAEKNKLAGIESGATKTVIDTALNASSTNPVQNKVINGALNTLDSKISNISSGITFKGMVNYVANLPSTHAVGDLYVVKYSGSSPSTTIANHKYIWGSYNGTMQWIDITTVYERKCYLS